MAAFKNKLKKEKVKLRPDSRIPVIGFRRKFLILVMFAACLILMISAFGMGGIVGNAISSVCFGIMGLCAYLFPIVLFGGVTFLIVNNKNCLAYKKIFAGIVFFIFLCGLLQLLTERYTPSTTFADYYALSSEYHTGGGVLGGAVCISTASAFWHSWGCSDHCSGIAGVYDHHYAEILFGFMNKNSGSVRGCCKRGT